MEKRNNSLDIDHVDRTVFLSGSDFKYSSKVLKGGNLSAIMGSNKVILSDADMVGNTLTINVFAFWGSIELYIPKNWKLNVKCIPIMGGIQHKVISEENFVEKVKTLTIKGTIIMSNIEFKQ